MSSGSQELFAVVTGGGTAGHVLPALAVAEALVARGHPPESLLYAGAKRGIETRLLPPAGFPHVFYNVDGFQRRISGRNLAFVPRMLRAVRAANRLLKHRRAQVVVSVGGYASLPMVLAARRRRIPVVVVSFDKRPGRASIVAARNAAACAVAFPDSPLPRATVTGAPVRQSILAVDRALGRAAARDLLGVPQDRFLVTITGGSLGSGTINDVVAAFVERHRDDATLAVRHVVGERFLAAAPPARRDPSGILYDVIGYEERMPLVYAAADVLVGRGGASTVTEAAVTGTPSILVPWPGAAEDHQTDNIQWLSDAGAAVLVPDAEFTIDRFELELAALRTNSTRLASIAAKAFALGEPHRHGRLAELIESVAERREARS